MSIQGGVQWDQLGNAGWPIGNVSIHPPKVVQGIMHTLVQSYSVTIPGKAEGILHGTEEILRTRQGNRH